MWYYRIGDQLIGWEEAPFSIIEDEFMKKFKIESSEELPDITYQWKECDLSIFEKEKRVQKSGLCELYETKKGKLLIYHWATCRFAYGFFTDHLMEKKSIEIMVDPAMAKEQPISAVRFFSTVGMHSLFLKQQALVLHAAYIKVRDEGILFTAPSQTGKSTQAKLWALKEGAEILNEDRVLLRKKEDRWMAYGYPCSGSSSICHNETLPLKAIVLLRQGSKNEIHALSTAEKIRALLLGSEVYLWDEKEMDQIIAIANELIEEIPVIQLTCRPDEEAVQVLKNYLER